MCIDCNGQDRMRWQYLLINIQFSRTLIALSYYLRKKAILRKPNLD